MDNIDISIVFHVQSDPEYRYNIRIAEDELALESEEFSSENNRSIHFGSIDEMEAVAKSMMNAVNAFRNR